ncbi:hypothetical protein ACA081_01050 [Candidatus Hodgkinia cicadicola]
MNVQIVNGKGKIISNKLLRCIECRYNKKNQGFIVYEIILAYFARNWIE